MIRGIRCWGAHPPTLGFVGADAPTPPPSERGYAPSEPPSVCGAWGGAPFIPEWLLRRCAPDGIPLDGSPDSGVVGRSPTDPKGGWAGFRTLLPSDVPCVGCGARRHEPPAARRMKRQFSRGLSNTRSAHGSGAGGFDASSIIHSRKCSVSGSPCPGAPCRGDRYAIARSERSCAAVSWFEMVNGRLMRSPECSATSPISISSRSGSR